MFLTTGEWRDVMVAWTGFTRDAPTSLRKYLKYLERKRLSGGALNVQTSAVLRRLYKGGRVLSCLIFMYVVALI